MAKSKVDPLDIIMVMLSSILSVTVVSWFYGYGVYVTCAVIIVFVYVYMKAPRRTYPTAEAITEGVDLSGKIAFVTGTTSGIGVETVKALALRGAHVYMAARNEKKLEDVKANLLKTLPQGTKLSILTCDLSDLESVKSCAQNFLSKEREIHILINNAGIMSLPERTPTKQGLESQVGVCHVGHFYLTKLLMPALEAGARSQGLARVVALSSMAHTYHEMSKCLQSPKLETEPYDPRVCYGNAKCSNLLFASEFQKKFYSSKKICAFSVHPGGIFTGLQDHIHPWLMFKWAVVAPFLFKSISQGAATSLMCATTADPDSDGGEYFDNCKSTEAVTVVEQAAGADAGKKLWSTTEKILADAGF